MKKPVRFLVIVFILAFMAVSVFGCVRKGVSGGAGNQAAEPPQKVFIDGAKTLISTDISNLLTENESGASLLGLSSDFFDDLNNSSNKTAIAATLKNLVLNGEASAERGNIGLDIAHNAESGDSSVDLSIGQGSDTNLACGIYIKDGAALLKPASADKNILQFPMPENNDKTLVGSISALFSGLLSEDGKSGASSLEARQELADRLLDPWMNDTKPEDYADSKETRTLLNKDVECRVITLSLSGRTAYDFVLKNVNALDTDAQFNDMNGTLGFASSSAAIDLNDIMNNSGKLNDSSSNPATKQILDELNALTEDEIAAVKFKAAVIFNDGKAIGIEVDASTAEKAFGLDMISYRKELEHQMTFTLQNLDGSSFSLDVSKIKSDGNNYQVSSTLKAVNSDGVQTMGGQYNGTAAEAENRNDVTGTFRLDMQVEDADGILQKASFSGDIENSMNRSDSGYSGSGNINLSVNAGDSQMSMTLAFTANMEKSKDIVITAPMFTGSNVSKVADFKSLCEALGQDYSSVEGQNALVKGICLFNLLLVS